MTRGVHTSEFWATVGTVLVGGMTGVLEHDDPRVVVAAIIAAAAVACTYTYARMRVKVESERCED